MSILKKPYEIAIYDDVFDSESNTFKEKRLAVIGSDKMTSQHRAFNPNLITNVNGQTSFSFQMYRHYIDITTGENVENPFCDWLTNERKVKLNYDGVWYDFIVKDVSEDSSTYLYTYKLEDALVQELSKNGFGVTLDKELGGNIDSSKRLAETVLKETDWEVGDCDVAVQTISETLVYVRIPAGTANIKRLRDPSKNSEGYYTGVSEESIDAFENDITVLAFYSSCKEKPHRFQFIYSVNGYDKTGEKTYAISRKDDRTIDEKDCQYYIQINNISNYDVEVADYGLYLPHGFRVEAAPTNEDTTISSWYRGARYGFSQQSVYVPLLEKYCQEYTKETDDGEKEYLGYVDVEYVSPTVIQNYITNYKFESTSGWTAATSTALSSDRMPSVENVLGRWQGAERFVSILDDFINGDYDDETTYTPYMKITTKTSNSFILNSGIYDNRTIIENMSPGEEWVLDYVVLDSSGNSASNLAFSLGEYKYNTRTGCYEGLPNSPMAFTPRKLGTVGSKQRIIFKVDTSYGTKEEFKKNSRIYLAITPPAGNTSYYIEYIALYKKVIGADGQTIITPDCEETTNLPDQGVLKKTYNYFPKDCTCTSVDQLPLISQDELDYTTYTPVYNTGAEKIRSVTAAESNYFNILQSISETFEQWLILDTVRDESGAITQKKVSFRNYRGDDNYACFRYGVNLVNIQRAITSKNIVTKLYVKANNNELADNGFCTIQRAGANPTGESYIYDFQYYHNKGLMDVDEYLTTSYYFGEGDNIAQGPDLALWEREASSEYTLYGYFPRIKKINDTIEPIQKELSGLKIDLIERKSELEVAKATYEAATEGIQAAREDFRLLTGLYPEDSQISDIKEITSYPITIDLALDSESKWYTISNKSLSHNVINFTVGLNEGYTGEKKYEGQEFTITISPTIITSRGSSVTLTYKIKDKLNKQDGEYKAKSFSQAVTPVDTSRQDVQKYYQEYITFREQINNSSEDISTIQKIVDAKEKHIQTKEKYAKDLSEYKRTLNQLFFKRYSRFIQEGTWINEEYVDDNKYYADAQSVLYNSCYPQVTYNIQTLELSKLPGYELFNFALGDKTWAIDDEFFGEGVREEVIITEKTENLDDPSQNSIKVQNFKNQFQDLFQRITATVQQAQYNAGFYEKGGALVDANDQKKSNFITNAINNAQSYIKAGATVDLENGVLVSNNQDPKKQLWLLGGAILFKTEDPRTKENTWRAGVTSEGITADLITAGRIDVGRIQIMSGDSPVFRWDAYGISAYDAVWYDEGELSTISGVNSSKFVRFDKNGIYGINNASNNGVWVDGATWHPNNIDQINELATFALTWEGLKVTGPDNTKGVKTIALLGKNAATDDNTYIMRVYQSGKDEETNKFSIDTKGNVFLSGTIDAENGNIGGWTIEEGYLIKKELGSDGKTVLYEAGLHSGDAKIVGYDTPYRFYIKNCSGKMSTIFTETSSGSNITFVSYVDRSNPQDLSTTRIQARCMENVPELYKDGEWKQYNPYSPEIAGGSQSTAPSWAHLGTVLLDNRIRYNWLENYMSKEDFNDFYPTDDNFQGYGYEIISSVERQLKYRKSGSSDVEITGVIDKESGCLYFGPSAEDINKLYGEGAIDLMTLQTTYSFNYTILPVKYSKKLKITCFVPLTYQPEEDTIKITSVIINGTDYIATAAITSYEIISEDVVEEGVTTTKWSLKVTLENIPEEVKKSYNTVKLGLNYKHTQTNYPFAVFKNGQVLLNDAIFAGSAFVTSGRIGPFDFQEDHLVYNGGVSETATEAAVFKIGNLGIDKSGKLEIGNLRVNKLGELEISDVLRIKKFTSFNNGMGCELFWKGKFQDPDEAGMDWAQGEIYNYNGLTFYASDSSDPMLGICPQSGIEYAFWLNQSTGGTATPHSSGHIYLVGHDGGIYCQYVTTPGSVSAATLYGTIGGDGSDIRLKNTIIPLETEDKYTQFFDSLQPKSFFFNKDATKTRLGFIAQDVLDSMDACGFSQEQKNGIYYENNGYAGLYYMEFIPLNILETQKLKLRTQTVEEKLIAQESRISAIETELQNLTFSQNSDII